MAVKVQKSHEGETMKYILSVLVSLCILVPSAWGAPCSESPTGQTNCEVFSGRDQNVLAIPAPNYLKLTGNNAAGIAVPTPAAGECVFGDTTATSATDEFSLMCNNGLTVGTSLLVSAINGSSAADGDITIQGTTDATRTTSYVNLQPNGGSVGIGTASPGAKLQINETVAATNSLVRFSSANVAHGMTLYFPTSMLGQIGAPGDLGGGLKFHGLTDGDEVVPALLFDGTLGGTPASTTSAIKFRAYKKAGTDPYGALAATDTAIQFGNGNTGLMTILGGGNVGIGTTTPTEKLTLKNGHISTMQTTAPTVTAGGCVTNTVTTKSTDTVGEVTLAGTCTTVSTVTITFNLAHTSRPICNAFFTSVNAGGLTVKTTDASAVNTMVITFSGDVTTGDKIGWHCLDMDTAA